MVAALAARAWPRNPRAAILAVAITVAVTVRPEVWGVPSPHAPLHLDALQLFWSSWLALVTLALLVLAYVVYRPGPAAIVGQLDRD